MVVRLYSSASCVTFLRLPRVTPVVAPAARRPPPVCSTPLDIVFVSAEVAPWSKTGGLGDVMGALPQAMAARGHRVMVVVPR